jgi:hypothetical protein
VQDVAVEVKLGVAARRKVGLPARRVGAGVVPPLVRRLAGQRDHRIEQHNHPHQLADHGRGEPAE